MKNLMLALVLLFSFAPPIAFAASDCAHTCCRDYNGNWDTDFDDCRAPASGYDACVSQCEAQVAAGGPVAPDTSGGTHYTCCSTAFILMAFAGALFLRRD